MLLQDKRIRWALGIGFIQWLIIGLLIAIFRNESLFCAGGIFIGATWLQLAILFYSPPSPLTKAQKLFKQGQYEKAATLLEPLNNIQARTLLGNTYRQLNQLTISEQILRETVKTAPNHAFPLYGLGRTLLAKGQFSEARQFIQQALDNHARRAIRADLALAYYLEGNKQAAIKEAQRASRILQLELHRALIVNYILYQVNEDAKALALMVKMADGLAFWQSEAERFADTPYGQRLQAELANIKGVLTNNE